MAPKQPQQGLGKSQAATALPRSLPTQTHQTTATKAGNAKHKPITRQSSPFEPKHHPAQKLSPALNSTTGPGQARLCWLLAWAGSVTHPSHPTQCSQSLPEERGSRAARPAQTRLLCRAAQLRLRWMDAPAAGSGGLPGDSWRKEFGAKRHANSSH